MAAGPVVNPMGYIGQIEGGASMALGFTLMENAVMEGARSPDGKSRYLSAADHRRPRDTIHH